MNLDGLFYKHECPACQRVAYDALPLLLCPLCMSADVVVTFDHDKRVRHLAKLTGTVATDRRRTPPID